MNRLFTLNIVNAVIAMVVSIYQTHKIIKHLTRSNSKNTLLLLISLTIATTVSIIGNNFNVKKMNNKSHQN